ncbi:STAS/SEC14 domain-containing protein [bacterium]|nr:STAS/SEC14 domain-containing protein [bacterium]MCB2179342.1 STAS/SEC14 domain-containing protein [bacterium]
MSHKIAFREDSNILATIFDGKVTPNEVEEVVVENLNLAIQYQTNLFLVDCRNIEDESSFAIENYETGVLLTKLSQKLPGHLKDALIQPISPLAAENLRFFETVTRNRGLNVRLFETEEAALAWLLE